MAFLVPAAPPHLTYPIYISSYTHTLHFALKRMDIGRSNIQLEDLTCFQRMEASPGTELVNPASPPTTSHPSHLKAYPYLFVRETDQVTH